MNESKKPPKSEHDSSRQTIPFDDALRKMLSAPPAHKAAKKPIKKKPAK